MRTSLARRDATPAPGEDLLEALGRHQPTLRGRASEPRRHGRRRPARQPRSTVETRLDGLAALLGEPGGDVDVERRQVVEARQPEPLEELEAGAVQERPAGRVGAAELDDQAPVQQRPDGVVGVDAADALDGGLA